MQHSYLYANRHIKEGIFVTLLYPNVYFENIAQMIVEHFDNFKYSDHIFIIGDNFKKQNYLHIPEKYQSKKIIFYQVEPLVSYQNTQNSFLDTCDIIKFYEQVHRDLPRSKFEIWDMDLLNKVYLEQRTDMWIDRVVPARYTKSLKIDPLKLKGDSYLAGKDIDVLQFQTPTPRRFEATLHIANASYFYSKWKWISVHSCVDHEYLAHLISRSKVILNIHHGDKIEFQEQFRLLQCVMNDTCVLSEPSRYNYFKNAIVECPLGQMHQYLDEYVDNGKWMEFADSSSIYKKVCEESNFAV
jgi:hypothetical protein